MARQYGDRILETSTTTGTGTYSLGGAVTGFRTFGAVCSSADTIYYAASDGSAGWEVGLGTFTSGSPSTLARTTVLSSSNSNSAVSWAAGTKTIWADYPATLIGRHGGVSGFIETPTAKTYTFCVAAPRAGTVLTATTKLASGTLTANFQIAGVSITSLSAIAVTSSKVTTTATAANAIAAGDSLTVIVSSISSPADFAFTLDVI